MRLTRNIKKVKRPIKMRQKSYRINRSQTKYNKVGGGLFGWIKSKISTKPPDNSNIKLETNNFDTVDTPNNDANSPPEPILPNPDTAIKTHPVPIFVSDKKVDAEINRANNVADIHLLLSATQVIVPLLVSTGFGLPLAGLLMLVQIIAQKYQYNEELKSILVDINNILSSCLNLAQLICFADSLYIKKIASDPNNSDTVRVLRDELTKSNISNIITTKILTIHNILKEKFGITPIKTTDDSNWVLKQFKKIPKLFNSSNNVLMAEFFRDLLLRQITMVNSYFILFNNHYVWRVIEYNKMLNLADVSEIEKEIINSVYHSNFLNDVITFEGEIKQQLAVVNSETDQSLNKDITDSSGGYLQKRSYRKKCKNRQKCKSLKSRK